MTIDGIKPRPLVCHTGKQKGQCTRWRQSVGNKVARQPERCIVQKSGRAQMQQGMFCQKQHSARLQLNKRSVVRHPHLRLSIAPKMLSMSTYTTNGSTFKCNAVHYTNAARSAAKNKLGFAVRVQQPQPVTCTSADSANDTNTKLSTHTQCCVHSSRQSAFRIARSCYAAAGCFLGTVWAALKSHSLMVRGR